MDNNNEEEEKKRDIEVVEGDGSDLEISPVYDHIKIDKPTKVSDKKQIIVIPEDKNKNKK